MSEPYQEIILSDDEMAALYEEYDRLWIEYAEDMALMEEQYEAYYEEYYENSISFDINDEV